MDYKLWLLVSWKDLSKREQYVKIRRSLVCVSNSGLCLCPGLGGRGEGDSGLVTWTSSSKVILIFLGKKTESKVCKLKTCVIIIMWNIPLKIINEFHTIYCLFCVTSTMKNEDSNCQGITHKTAFKYVYKGSLKKVTTILVISTMTLDTIPWWTILMMTYQR